MPSSRRRSLAVGSLSCVTAWAVPVFLRGFGAWRLAHGNAGDAKPVGDGVFELRMLFGPGYRAYFMYRDGIVILLLAGGDKDSQKRDIGKARHLARRENDDTQDDTI
ncbi:MAG: type II toxin-antitoxin system RelE/ParE family toxin [Sphingomonas bacterium]